MLFVCLLVENNVLNQDKRYIHAYKKKEGDMMINQSCNRTGPVNKFEPADRHRLLPVHIEWLDRSVLPVFTVFRKIHMCVNSRLVRNYVSATVIFLKSQL